MAIADSVGHGRRGEARYVRKPDGREELEIREVLERWEINGALKERLRKKESRILADDLPWIADQYRRIRGEEK